MRISVSKGRDHEPPLLSLNRFIKPYGDQAENPKCCTVSQKMQYTQVDHLSMTERSDEGGSDANCPSTRWLG